MTPVVTESLSRPIFIKEIGKNIKELPIKKGTRLDGVTGILLNLHRPVNPYATECIPEPWKRKKSSSRSFLWSEYNIDLYTKLQTPQFFTSLYSHVFCYGILLCSPLWAQLCEFGQGDFHKHDVSQGLESPYAVGIALALLSAFFMKVSCLS